MDRILDVTVDPGGNVWVLGYGKSSSLYRYEARSGLFESHPIDQATLTRRYTEQAVAFMLTHRRDSGVPTTGNSVSGNTFVTFCESPRVGLGYFVGRGTGYTDAGEWSAETTVA